MSKDKKINQNQAVNNQPKQEAKQEPKQPAESKESLMAKQIIDLQNAAEANKKVLEEKDKKIDELNKKLEEYASTYKQLIADAEVKANALIKEQIDLNQTKLKDEITVAKMYAIEDHALELIAVINDLDRACSFPVKDDKVKNFLTGFKMILTKFNNLLTELHIETINPEVGSMFDSKTMECFADTVNDPSKQNDTIVEVIEKGYKLYAHILKPALVKVVKNN